MPHEASAESPLCWLCGRVLGRRVEWHHPRPKSRGGRAVVGLHPICHRAIHARFSNAELARLHGRDASAEPMTADAELARFIAWLAGKPPDFHAPTRRRR